MIVRLTVVICRSVECRHVHTGLHDLLHLGIDEIDDARQHHMLLRARALRHVYGIGQLVERYFALVHGLLADAAGGVDQQVGERVEDPAQDQQRLCHHRSETHRHGLSEHLRKDLAEEQKQEGHQHGLEEEFETEEREDRIDDVGREDDDADVHEVVDDQNGSQQQIHVPQQAQHGGGRSAPSALEPIDIVV